MKNDIEKIFMNFLNVDRLDIDLFEHETKLNTVFLSVFDHWLNEQEANDLLHENNQNLKFYYKRLETFYYHLIKKNDTYLVQENNKITLSHLSEDSDKFSELIHKNIYEENFQHFFIPSLTIEIVGNYDFTHVIYYKDVIPNIVKIASEEHNLYLLH